MLNLAQELIFERYKQPLFGGTLKQADIRVDGANPVCGDEIHIDMRLDAGKIAEIRHSGRSCAICTASADLLAETWIGKSLKEIQATPVEEITGLIGIPLSPIRLKCALLPLETIRLAHYQVDCSH
ncbi:MAG: iron-sulfur cluster assembly scaffold protein [bacterium]